MCHIAEANVRAGWKCDLKSRLLGCLGQADAHQISSGHMLGENSFFSSSDLWNLPNFGATILTHARHAQAPITTFHLDDIFREVRDGATAQSLNVWWKVQPKAITAPDPTQAVSKATTGWGQQHLLQAPCQ